MNNQLKMYGVFTIGLVLLVSSSALLASDLSVKVPDLEFLAVSASALYEMGQDNCKVAREIIEYHSLSRAVELRPIELGINGSNLAKYVAATVFHPEGVYTTHLNKSLHKQVTIAFIRVIWGLGDKSLTYFEVVTQGGTSIVGDDARVKAPTALGILQGERLLIMRGIGLER